MTTITDAEVARRQAERARKREEERLRKNLEAAGENLEARKQGSIWRGRWRARVLLNKDDGMPKDCCVFVLSDMHFYPGEKATLAIRAALHLADKLKPWAIVNNGDAIDGASISRWPVSSFIELAGQPSVAEEIGAAARQLAEFEALPYVKRLIWNLGNHDARFETWLARKVPEFAEVHGFTLKDHFPGWAPAWSTWINDDLVVKHRFKSGKYAAANNAVESGRSMVTGHDHMLWAKAFTDYNGTRWGVGAGTTADIYAKSFVHYTEDNPVNWQQGFALLHFADHKFIGPELVHCLPDGRIPFRGKLLKLGRS